MISRRTVISVLFLALLVILSVERPGFAQDDTKYRLDFDVGYRFDAGFRGSEDLYRSQINLREGLRLFSLNLFVTSAETKNNIFDHLELRMNNWGEPHAAAYFRMAKNSVYELSFSHQRMEYFNSIATYANPLLEKGNPVSQHRFDTRFNATSFEIRFRQDKSISPFVAFKQRLYL